MPNKLVMKSSNVINEHIKQIQKLFPNVVTEISGASGTTLAIDFDILKQELSNVVIDEKQERYQMTWPDKKKSLLLANSRINGTLRPLKDKSVDFDNTQNLYIEGDNLDVLKLLRETYLGKVKMIYIDPPYNTGEDFVYEDNFKLQEVEYLDKTNQYDDLGNRLFLNNETNGRFHTDWLNMMYPRLKVSRDLLTDDGVIFISIDDNEVDNLRKICDEIFGYQNFIAHIIHKNNSMKNQSKYIGVSSEFVLVYSKDINYLKNTVDDWRIEKKGSADIKRVFQNLKNQGVSIDEIHNEIMAMYSRPKYAHLARWNKVDENGVFTDKDLSRSGGRKDYTIINPFTGKPCPIPSRGWGKSKEELERLQSEGLIWYGNGDNPPREKSYLSTERDTVFDNFFYADTSVDKKMLDEMLGNDVFEYPKSLEMILSFLKLSTSNDDIILDFFSGSATTAHGVLQLNSEDNGNRKFILVQIPEKCAESHASFKAGYKTICDIGEERIRRAGKKVLEEYNKNNKSEGLFTNESNDCKLDIGFRVLRLDSSNMNDVYYNANATSQSLFDNTVDNVKSDRTPLDLLFQVMLELGIELSAKIEEKEISGKKYFVVNENDIVACFDSNVNNDVIKELAQIKPIYAVFRDSVFENDSANINCEQLFKTISPSTTLKVL